jgi:flagellar M-ring protein FliF
MDQLNMDQLNKLISGLNAMQRVSIVAAVLMAASGIFAVVHYRREGDFRPLYSGMAPEDAAQVVQKLKESSVEYRLAENGGTVLVPSARLADSRLALASAGLPKSGRIGFELFDKTNFGATELVEHINYQRALEGELERSIMSLAEVIQARVHLSFPKESVFLDQQQSAKASVMVKLRPGARISPQNVVAITNMIASAVEGLNPDGVAVLDMDGNLLSRPRLSNPGDAQVTTESLEVRQQIERDLVAKISATLEPLLGASQFRAGASVDCDLTSGDQQEETFNPDQSVMVSSQKTEDTNERTLPGPIPDRTATGGVPGTASNLPHPPAQIAGGTGTSHRTENVTFQSSRVVKHTRIPQGVIRRMSLSVLVGQPAHWEGSGKNRHRVVVPPSAETLKTIRDLVSGVTGFSQDRGDQLIVETLPFEPPMDADASPFSPQSASKPPGPAWLAFLEQYQSVLIIAVVLVTCLSLVLRVVLKSLARNSRNAGANQIPLELPPSDFETPAPLQAPVPAIAVSGPTPAALQESDEQAAARIRTFAQNDPGIAANVLRMWIQSERA